MIKRIIDISEQAYLHLQHRQLLIDKQGKTVAQVPIEDLGILILQHPAIVVTQAAVVACQQHNVALVLCDERHLPYAALLPLTEGNSLHGKILQQQTGVNAATKKRLWRQIVKHKITEQAATLRMAGKNDKPLQHLAQQIKNGDAENREAQAAQKYWRLLFGDEFRRDPEAEGVNSVLNYGYAIVRAMLARAIVGAGLHPALGLHHQNQYDSLCLADDLMEPFRPWVDYVVYRRALETRNLAVTREDKVLLLGLLSAPVMWDGQRMPLMVACHYMLAQLKRAYADSAVKLAYPQLESRLQP